MKYGGLHKDEQRLYALMDAEEVFIRNRPAQRLRVWVDFYETALSGNVPVRFAAHVKRLEGQLVKLAVVGCPLAARYRLNKAIRHLEGGFSVPLCYFNDPEDAKTWLVT